MRCKRTPAVGAWPSAARTVLGWQEGGRTYSVRAARIMVPAFTYDDTLFFGSELLGSSPGRSALQSAK